MTAHEFEAVLPTSDRSTTKNKVTVEQKFGNIQFLLKNNLVLICFHRLFYAIKWLGTLRNFVQLTVENTTLLRTRSDDSSKMPR
jgi:hypothetical protein